MDRERTLRFVNDPARLLLGYEEDEVLGSRCRLTTRGVDCECACPLTFALEHDLETVRDFTAVYLTKAGKPVHLNVTIVPLRDAAGDFLGAVEVLRPTLPSLGFYLAGASDLAQSLRRRAGELARMRDPILLIGAAPACADVARAVHRLGGLGDELFHRQRGETSDALGWPPGTLYVDAEDVDEPTAVPVVQGWRVVVGARVRPPEVSPHWQELELPTPDQRIADLPFMVAAWVDELAPGLGLAPGASARLCQQALELGLARLAEILTAAVAVADGELREEHLPEPPADNGLVDDILGSANPLESLEARVLCEVLERHGWRMQEAADRLGMSRVTLWRKLREHGIQRPAAD